MPIRDSRTPFSPELELVLRTAKSRLTDGDRAQIVSLLGMAIDWDTVIKLAGYHRTLSLLNLNLREIASDAVPSTVLERLQGCFAETVQRNLSLTRELIKILQLFKSHGILAVPFKGPFLATRFYGHIGYRSFSDLDILVRRESIIHCAQLLESAGYMRPATQIGVKEQAHLQSQVGLDFRHRNGKISIELNWALIQKWLCFRIDPEALWGRLGTVQVAGVDVPALELEDEFLFLCAHGAKHQWERLFWIADIAEGIRSQPSLDWDKLLSRAKRSGSRRVLLWASRLAHELLGADVAPPILELANSDPVVGRLTRTIIKQLAAQDEPRPGPESKSDILYLLERERIADKIVYLFHLARLVFTPSSKDHRFAKLPKSLSVFYFLVRPARIVVEFFSPRLRHTKTG